MNTFQLSLDLDKSYTGEPVRLRQGDKRGTEIRATIYDHGEPFTGSYTARYVQAIAGTGNEYYRADATFAAGVATVTVNEEYAAAVAGNAYGYFQFVSGSTVIASTQSFPVIVLPDATAEAEVGERYDSAIEDALAELDEATGRISQMVQDATAEYLEAHPEITTTVQDNSLDDDKLIQKGGILQREQWLESLVPVLKGITKETAEADVHSVTDSAGGGPLGIEVYGRSTQDGTPTPDAPVPIVSVESPNLLDPSGINATNRGLTASYEGDGWIRLKGTVTGSAAALILLWGSSDNTKYFLPSGTYHVLVENDGACISESNKLTVQCVYNSGSSSGTQVLWGDTMSMTINAVGGVSRIAFLLNSNLAAGTVVDGRVRVTLASDGFSAWVPAGGAALRCVGRNLMGGYMLHAAGGASIEQSGSSFRVAASSSAWAGVSLTNGTAEALGILNVGETYTLSADVSVTSGVVTVGFRGVDNNTFVDSRQLTSSGHISVTCTVPRPVYVSFLVTNGSTTTGDATFSNVQLELGGTEHAYQPYTETVIPIDLGGRSLRSLPDGTRDEVVVDEWGHAILTQRVGAHTLTSATAWSVDASPADYGYFYTRAFDSEIRGNYVYTGWCDRFPSSDTYLTPSRATRNVIAIGNDPSGTNSLRLSIAKSLLSEVSLAGLRAWLDANPTTFYYPLATPVTIDLGHLDPALLPAPDLTAYVVPSAPSVLRYGFDVAAAIAEIATS